jgi:hypothetical protein
MAECGEIAAAIAFSVEDLPCWQRACWTYIFYCFILSLDAIIIYLTLSSMEKHPDGSPGYIESESSKDKHDYDLARSYLDLSLRVSLYVSEEVLKLLDTPDKRNLADIDPRDIVSIREGVFRKIFLGCCSISSLGSSIQSPILTEFFREAKDDGTQTSSG